MTWQEHSNYQGGMIEKSDDEACLFPWRWTAPKGDGTIQIFESCTLAGIFSKVKIYRRSHPKVRP